MPPFGAAYTAIRPAMRKGSPMKRPEEKTQLGLLLSGWGYWDVTSYSRGGCFRRASADMPVTIHGDKIKGEYWGTFQNDGRRFCADARSIQIIDAPSAVDMCRGHGGVS